MQYLFFSFLCKSLFETETRPLKAEIQNKACQFKNKAMCFNEHNNSTHVKTLSIYVLLHFQFSYFSKNRNSA